MSAAREQVLAHIRRALGRGELDGAQLTELRERIARHPRQIEPAFSEPPRQRFQQKLEAAEASFVALDTLAEVAAEVERYLDASAAPRRLVTSGDELLQALEWPQSIELRPWLAKGDDKVSLTTAHCGIAETGTLLLVSGEHKSHQS